MATARTEPPIDVSSLGHVRELVDAEILRFLADRRAELSAMDRTTTVLVDEILRLLRAGGKRIRPALCVWSYRAARGDDVAIAVRAGAALELLHTFAMIHDDVMDMSGERRGVASTHARFAEGAPAGVDPGTLGGSIAILVGDLAAVLAEQLLRSCGAPQERLQAALRRFDRMRLEMAAGQLLDLRATGTPSSPRIAALKTGSYTTQGPVLVGTALAGAGPAIEGPLLGYAQVLGEAFQMRDDFLDGQAGPETASRADELATRAATSLEGAPLEPGAAAALAELATALRLPQPQSRPIEGRA